LTIPINRIEVFTILGGRITAGVHKRLAAKPGIELAEGSAAQSAILSCNQARSNPIHDFRAERSEACCNTGEI